MRPSELDHMPAAPTPSAEECLWRGMRQRLQGVANGAGVAGTTARERHQ